MVSASYHQGRKAHGSPAATHAQAAASATRDVADARTAVANASASRKIAFAAGADAIVSPKIAFAAPDLAISSLDLAFAAGANAFASPKIAFAAGADAIVSPKIAFAAGAAGKGGRSFLFAWAWWDQEVSANFKAKQDGASPLRGVQIVSAIDVIRRSWVPLGKACFCAVRSVPSLRGRLTT